MIAVIRITIVVMSLFLAAIVGVRTVSAAQKSPIVALFSAPDGTPCVQPCMFGVRPGETSFNDGLLLLKEHPLLRGLEEQLVLHDSGIQFVVFSGTGIRVTVLEDGNERIWHITVQIDLAKALTPIASTGEIVAFLGAPDLVLIDNRYIGPVVSIYYRQSNLEIANERPSSFVNKSDRSVSFFIQSTTLEEWAGATPWQGFTTIDRYVPNTIR
jgi:hypothetical protein